MVKKIIKKILLLFFGIKIIKTKKNSFFFADYNKGNDLFNLNIDKDIDVLIDIGVGSGTPSLYTLFPQSKIILIDPILDENYFRSKLKDRKIDFYPFALSSNNHSKILYYDQKIYGLSSLFKRTELTKRNHQIIEKKINTKKLEELINVNDLINKKILIKIDTEGSELDILIGSKKILKYVSFIICEVSIMKRFENSYTFEMLICFLESNNFVVDQFIDFSKDKNGNIVFADILFKKKDLL